MSEKANPGQAVRRLAHLALYKVCGQVLDSNERSIRFHLAMDFQLEDTLGDQYFDGNHYRAIHFGLLQSARHAKQRETES